MIRTLFESILGGACLLAQQVLLRNSEVCQRSPTDGPGQLENVPRINLNHLDAETRDMFGINQRQHLQENLKPTLKL